MILDELIIPSLAYMIVSKLHGMHPAPNFNH